jgi:hypothetical protein
VASELALEAIDVTALPEAAEGDRMNQHPRPYTLAYLVVSCLALGPTNCGNDVFGRDSATGLAAVAIRPVDRVAATCTTIETSAGRLTPNSASPGIRQRIGVALRKHRDDGVHSYRIPALAATPKGTLLCVYDTRRRMGRDLQEDIDTGLTAWTRLEKSSYPEELFSRKRAKESSAISVTTVTIAIAEHLRGQICEAGAAGVACGLPIPRARGNAA